MKRLRTLVRFLKPSDAQQFLNQKDMTTELGGGKGSHAALKLAVSSALGSIFKTIDSSRTGLWHLFLTVASLFPSSAHFTPQFLLS